MAKKKLTWVEQVIEAQRDLRFVEWMAAMDERLAWFRANVFPDFAGDPYALEAVNAAERRLLEVFPSREHMRSTPETDAIIDGFARFIGEAFVHGLGGKWMKIPQTDADEEEERWYSAIVSTGDLPRDTRDFVMVPTLNVAVRERSGHEFSWLWDRVVERMAENGRDPRTNSTDLIAQLRRENAPAVDYEEITPKHPDTTAYAFIPKGQLVTQQAVRAIFDAQFADTAMVVSEVPYRIDATDPDTGRIIGVILKTADVSPTCAEYIEMTLEEHPHARSAEFGGATDLLHLFITEDPDGDLLEGSVELTDSFTHHFRALVYLPSIEHYDD